MNELRELREWKNITTGDNERQSPTGKFEAGQGIANLRQDVVTHTVKGKRSCGIIARMRYIRA